MVNLLKNPNRNDFYTSHWYKAINLYFLPSTLLLIIYLNFYYKRKSEKVYMKKRDQNTSWGFLRRNFMTRKKSADLETWRYFKANNERKSAKSNIPHINLGKIFNKSKVVSFLLFSCNRATIMRYKSCSFRKKTAL